jgi:FkbM family methyltransferase
MEKIDTLKLIQAIIPSMESTHHILTPDFAIAKAITLAKSHTKRNKVIVLVDPKKINTDKSSQEEKDILTIAADKSQRLCEAIALSKERIAAIVIRHHQAAPYYYKKVRELSSAEGALMIWDQIEFDNNVLQQNLRITKHCQPDIACFSITRGESSSWIGSRKGIIELETINFDRYNLPNGEEIFHINDYETDFLFNEIFIDETYLQHGIKIKECATIFDVGANIGLFSLYIKEKFQTSKLYAFEPAPATYAVLDLNMKKLSKDIKTYNFGLSDTNAPQTFYYYPGYSVISGCYADQQRDADIIVSGMMATNKNNDKPEKISRLVNNRLSKKIAYQCQMITLSSVIKNEQIMKIDLLKIDVEGAELAVLHGISQNDWEKINQIVMEVHNKEDLNIITEILTSKNFLLHIESDKNLKKSGIYNVFAIKDVN